MYCCRCFVMGQLNNQSLTALGDATNPLTDGLAQYA